MDEEISIKKKEHTHTHIQKPQHENKWKDLSSDKLLLQKSFSKTHWTPLPAFAYFNQISVTEYIFFFNFFFICCHAIWK